MRTTFRCALFLAFVPLLAASCIKRKERITVEPGGAVAFEVELDGDRGDFSSGDSLPAPGGAWTVNDSPYVDSEGTHKLKRTATLAVAAGAELPSSFALDAEAREVALSFPTELRVEERVSGTYFHFRRTFVARKHADFEYESDRMLEVDPGLEDVFQRFFSGEGEPLTEAERVRLAEALLSFDARTLAVHADEAARALAQEWPQDYGLTLRRALLTSYEGLDRAVPLELLAQPKSAERDREIGVIGERFKARARAALEAELVTLDTTELRRAVYRHAFDRSVRAREVTEDLKDEEFDLELEMPGRLISHNGVQCGHTNVTWQFKREAFLDRDYTVMASSFVDR